MIIEQLEKSNTVDFLKELTELVKDSGTSKVWLHTKYGKIDIKTLIKEVK